LITAGCLFSVLVYNNHPTLLDVTLSWSDWHLSMMIIHLKRKGTLVMPSELYYPMQSIFDPHTPSSLGIKFREMIVKGGATNLGTIFSNTNMRMSKQTFPNSYIPKCTTLPKARQRAQSEPRIPNGL